MNRYRHLRRLRIAISLIFALALAWISVDAAIGLTRIGAWVVHTQIVPAVLAGSAIWLVVWVLATITFGRIYCSSVCPMGTCMDAVGRMRQACLPKDRRRYRSRPTAAGF